MFAVVDIETTGSFARSNGITEVAIVVYDGREVVQRYEQLINPHQPIPRSIQALTGISDEMVAVQPSFADCAEEIREVLGDHIFVAHNVNFDYSFIRFALEQCGIRYAPKRMCTVRYARKLKPGLTSYSLKNLCKYFEVDNAAAHRAMGDANATAEILSLLMEEDKGELWKALVNRQKGEFNLPQHLPSELYANLPEKAGVYYMRDQWGDPIYIGMAKNIKKRVAGHFSVEADSAKNQAFKREIHHIDTVLTGTELLARLLEDSEIRKYWPKYNRAQKNPKRKYGLYAYQNIHGTWRLGVNTITRQQGYIEQFFNLHEAKQFALDLAERFGLNPMHCGLPAPLAKAKPPSEEEHNIAFGQMLNSFEEQSEKAYYRLTGRHAGEAAFVYVEGRHLVGYGFVPSDAEVGSEADLQAYLQPLQSSITTDRILHKLERAPTYQWAV